ncbi:MAG: PRC-barrel domain-containing protein, partial [Mesorhizobium sp.]
LGGSPYLGAGPSARREEDEAAQAQRDKDDPHLRSIAAVDGYHIHATDGDIGHVEDMLVEEADWSIRYMVLDTRNWWPGKKVLISPRSARNISWKDRTIGIEVDRQTVKSSPAYDASTTVDRDYENQFNTYYGGDRRSGHIEPASVNSVHS